jgi:hypothetical protein
MLAIPGGRERTIDEYGALLSAAGFRLVESRPAGFGLSVMVATPA